MTEDIDELAKEIARNCKTPEDFTEFFKQLKRRGLEAALAGELTAHLGYEKHDKGESRKDNSRNGYSKKKIHVSEGEMEIAVPRDRAGSFEPQLIPKHATRFDGLDEKIISFYSRGLSTRDIQSELEEIYGTTISPTLISNVTDAVLADVRAWQSRPLDSCFPIVYLDCLVVKVKTDKGITNKAVYLALGVNTGGQKELLGMWISQNEGAKFWLNVLTDLKNRGLDEIFIACVDGLTGFPEAIETVYPYAKVQLCIVHKIRQSLSYVSWKDRKILAADLKSIYSANTLIEAEMALDAFSAKWDDQYPSISISWRRDWERVIPLFDYPADIRRAIYTTNAIESLNMTLRKVIKNKRMFPSDEAVFKLLYLAIERISQKWTMPIHNWKPAMNRFMIEFGDRVTG
ncbi:TPA: IS256 family transposase [Legionella pneumophila]|nr:IS256 family transposase [Legionella pneumophila]HAU2502627.1 IS256 family transposase [Legionella pneumophila]HAU3544755.1 IS256 family transposase [Legionella pneumophila]HDU8238764.1 IS256 family transposase [Legionella pneumophila]